MLFKVLVLDVPDALPCLMQKIADALKLRSLFGITPASHFQLPPKFLGACGM
jgi:hypothetical protein